jgi:hypothetical protein
MIAEIDVHQSRPWALKNSPQTRQNGFHEVRVCVRLLPERSRSPLGREAGGGCLSRKSS